MIRWPLLVFVAVIVAASLQFLAVPGAWIVGPMALGVAYSVTGDRGIAVDRRLFIAAQAVIGCIFAQAFQPAVALEIARDWPVVLAVVVATIALSVGVGYVLGRRSGIDPSSAALGSMPGAASAIVAISIEVGADARIVAFMQYLRVLVVVFASATVTRLVFPAALEHARHPLALQNPTAFALAITALVAVVGIGLARVSRIPMVIGPMILGALVSGFHVAPIVVPWWCADAAFLTIGLGIGLLFTLPTLRYVLRMIPQLLLSSVVLMVGCAGIALLLVRFAHIDPLSAYLATAPGAMESVTAIAATSGANVAVVLSIQAARFFVVALTGPPLARLLARG